MPRFIFLEIIDTHINYLFEGISRAVSGEGLSKPPHLTIRGPYRGKIENTIIEHCEAQLSHDILRIGDVGRFENAAEQVVFFRVDSPNLRRVWWKPDFPIEQFGFNPHISIYRGRDRRFADALTTFLKHERVEILCERFRVVVHVSRQNQLLQPPVPITSYPFHLILPGNVRENFLDRLQLVVTRYQRRDIRPRKH